ncbi:molybdate ABC transporter substrate-binding protein [Limimaricola sp.]|uniref:molybdate ABC transporter substrate-binding protein n=1 Tax=Limimaricola sp. TaxID=2211665 RepID=UPI0025BA70A5|nr:molybdate ABC transporter substrate-binding protein [Limimaricola sp.]
MRLALALILTVLAAPLRAADLTIFAAASLRGPLDTAAAAWAAETGSHVAVSYAGTSTLARQIAAGAPADLFIAASTAWMDRVEGEGLVVPGSRVHLLCNTLVLVATAPAAPMALSDLPARLGNGKLAMATVDAVPAGQYGKAALSALGLWDAVAAQVAQADNVRAALALVARGEAPFGVVYATDARAEPKVAVVATFPDGTHAAIVYDAARIRGGAPAAADLLRFLQGPAALADFTAAGFAPPPPP